MKPFMTLAALLLAGFVHAAPLHQIVVFGDSLSDNGNLYEFMNHQFPQSPPYYEGRFSNGPVWVEHMMQKLPKVRLLDYAMGGSGVSEEEEEVLLTLKKQIMGHLLANHDKADPNSLYVVWIGANNYLGLPEDKAQALTEVNLGVLHGLQLLAEKGAKHILVINLPDLGKTPGAVEFQAVEDLSALAKQHNERLLENMDHLKQEHPAVQWLYFDFASLFDEVIDYPEHFGFDNVTETCLDNTLNIKQLKRPTVLNIAASVRPNQKRLQACDGYVFFDLVHPSGEAHAVVAEQIAAMLREQGVVFEGQ